ncbi:delta-1-pyrroline-5-carboxylate dehydrogenase 1 [Aureobasidium pullulans]|uniref:Multifunctional fusion protein n=1 Tax=Aureobasidium pullulans TaxID=5580 RepID=A0A4T0EX92_AURPU|nr:delta-1-pyrroline-5-carboxylate dehydrogenase 1 [Aureobasidium pullulans]THX22284.1 delta-1-pyrroline-5-carboxylate dehydrogenase 1 [Aureobasidium pullulans]THX57588.1 delta-1-pyrroline-5-carboxylate dehydrogenase 1 [Aureobasidium pullulans]TIA79259.1 delta-1-pyrroline-5-carboxylate dehydrogenase 1 [Aureobasidium pullulans]
MSKMLRSNPLARNTRLAFPSGVAQRRLASTAYKLPPSYNEPNLHYRTASPEREKLVTALSKLREQLPISVPTVKNGKEIASKDEQHTLMPSEIATQFAKYSPATKQDVEAAIAAALEAKQSWAETSFHDRAAIFLRAADLVSNKYRYELMAATMLGQGKNAWQAEIDAAAELADFYRFNVGFAEEIYTRQPTLHAQGQAGKTDWRPLEGFVYAVSPFNFTAIGGNLISGPALMGNVVLWKPSPGNIYSSYLVHKILLEAGLPPGVIQLVNGDAEMITDVVYEHREFAALNFTGSSDVFRELYARAGEGVRTKKYRDYPRMVAETSGKNFHIVHNTADIPNAVKHTIRASFEYAGQKCSACSRIYIPESRAEEFWKEMKDSLSPVKVGAPEDFSSFTGPVINDKAFNKITTAIDSANKDSQLEKIVGGTYDGSKGLFIEPTIYSAKTLDHPLFDQELFGPVLVAYVYPDAEYDALLERIDTQGGGLALTGAIFASDQKVIRKTEDRLRYAAGNFYTNCKTTGAVIGQQSFGGARGSGTNDKAGSAGMLMRFVAPRTLKEEYHKLEDVLYPHNY